MARMRLQRYLSQAGVAARRKAEELIVAGRVRVNGRAVTELGRSIDPAVDQVTVDGQAAYAQELFYCLLNKPKGTITAVSDPDGRPTVMEYLPNLPVAVKPVGRLDFYSEGVLLLTNDGELSAALQSPKKRVEKTYHVKFRGQVREGHIELMRRGVRLDDGAKTRPAQVDHLRSQSRHDWLVITLTEGKSRQIHRMAESLGYQVQKLQRVAFAGLDYFGLRVGDARELTQIEVNRLRELVGLPASAHVVARGRWRSLREDSDLARGARARQRRSEADQQPTAGPAGERSFARGIHAGRERRPAREDRATGVRSRRKDSDRAPAARTRSVQTGRPAAGNRQPATSLRSKPGVKARGRSVEQKRRPSPRKLGRRGQGAKRSRSR